MLLTDCHAEALALAAEAAALNGLGAAVRVAALDWDAPPDDITVRPLSRPPPPSTAFSRAGRGAGRSFARSGLLIPLRVAGGA